MKTLKQLGISPSPWKVVPYGLSTEDRHPTIGDVFDATGESITIDLPTYRDACMMGAAPLMYEALLEMVEMYRDGGSYDYEQEVITKAKAALAKAAGESEVEK